MIGLIFETSAEADPNAPDRGSSVRLSLPLTFGTEQLGIVVFEDGHHIAIYAMLREQIGAVIKAGSLHRAMIREIAARERAERDELQKELIIAREIQTAILPAMKKVQGLELAGLMLPAAESGGDYFDVLPTEDGCWLGIGDVAGHGLVAGIVMLMVQSMVLTLVRSGAVDTPSAVFESVNAALWDNVRHRLKRDEHATFTIIKYLRSGRLIHAGRHEDILIWRARQGKWEITETEGVWLGAIENVKTKTFDLELELHDGDLMVLYTDGITEAMNLQHEQFGIERLCSVIDGRRDDPVDRICNAVTRAVNEWAPVQADDLSVLIGRYSAP